MSVYGVHSPACLLVCVRAWTRFHISTWLANSFVGSELKLPVHLLLWFMNHITHFSWKLCVYYIKNGTVPLGMFHYSTHIRTHIAAGRIGRVWYGVMCSAKWNNMKWRLEANRRIFLFYFYIFCASIHKNTYPFRNVLHSIDKSLVLRFMFWISLAESMELVAQPLRPPLSPLFAPISCFLSLAQLS